MRCGRQIAIFVSLAAPCLAGCRAPSSRREVVVTTDVGTEVDDQWALAHLLLASNAGRFDLRAIITTHAPNLPAPAAHASACQALEVVSLFTPREPPFILTGLDGPVGPEKKPRRGPGAFYLTELSRSFSPANRLVVISLGAATDIAEAILADPGVVDRIEVVAMAFESWPEGRDPWNVKNDPGAYEVILDSRVPLTIGSASVCLPALNLDPELAESMTAGTGKRGAYLSEKLRDWLHRERELSVQTTRRVAWPIWDMVTVAHLLGMATSEVRKRPRLSRDMSFDFSGAGGEIRWITSVDSGRLWDDFRGLLLSP